MSRENSTGSVAGCGSSAEHTECMQRSNAHPARPAARENAPWDFRRLAARRSDVTTRLRSQEKIGDGVRVCRTDMTPEGKVM